MSAADIAALLTSYPRVRPPLTPAHERIYAAEYRLNRAGARPVEGLSKLVERWMHRQVARHGGSPVLELGAGTLNHLRFEQKAIGYDVVEPFAELYREAPERTQVRSMFASLAEVPDERRYRRIISVAALEHMTDLPAELARSGLHLEDDGLFQAGIPSEGGFMWWLGWRATTGLSYYLRNRLDFGVLMRHEHVSTAPEIVSLVGHFFSTLRIRRFPLPHQHLSLYAYLEASGPRRALCRDYLEQRCD